MMTREYFDELFSSDDNKSRHVDEIGNNRRLRREYEENIYKHPFFVLIRDRGVDEVIRWGCMLHPMIQNKNFDSIIHHMMFFQPEKHKEYIIKELFET